MLVYIIPTIYCLWGIYHYDYRQNSEGKIVCFYLLSVYLAVISGLSYKVGGDSGFYMDLYTFVPTLESLKKSDYSDSSYQPLYFLLCVLCKSITPKIWLMHLIQSLIVCIVYFRFIRNHTRYLFTGAFMFMTCMYTYFCYEIYKESIAVSMMLIGYQYLPQKKYLKYYIYATLSIMFHFSGIIAFFIPFLRKLKFNKVLLIWIGVLLFVLTGFQTYVTYFISSDMIIQKLDYYVLVATDKYNDNWYLMALIRNVLIPLFTAILFKQLYKNVPNQWSYVLYVLLGIGTLQLAQIFERPINYVLPFVVLSLSEIMGGAYKKRAYKFLTTFFVCFIFWFGCRGWFYAREEVWRLMIPYESIFDEKNNREREKVIMQIH
ncbi:EpsG family protein [Parabacteroides sp. ZJ-118]|uniref:EpsG family protein n=1 Tax=Parabacteroides sp. ZJ-118 TaxID=2709398 RepID=UPI0013EA1195|nr:EpsG family protein [Parabacteroides sp. ZJ-118]